MIKVLTVIICILSTMLIAESVFTALGVTRVQFTEFGTLLDIIIVSTLLIGLLVSWSIAFEYDISLISTRKRYKRKERPPEPYDEERKIR